jgi:hypothetical protein
MEKSTTDMTSKEYWESRYMSFITTSPNIRKLLHEPFAPLDKRYINNNLIKMEKKRKLRINAGN